MTDHPRILLVNKLRDALDKLIAQKATGEMILSNERILGEVFLLSGRLLYVADKLHRVRRWQRAIKKHCPTWPVSPLWSDEQPWEYALLAQGITKKQLNLNQVKAVISDIAFECFVELCYQNQLKANWKPQEMTKSALSYCLTLSASEIHPLFNQVETLHHQWNQSGLERIKPNLAPILNNTAANEDLPIAKMFLSGQLTVWDIAAEIEKPVTEVTRLLLPWVEKGIIELKSVNDLPSSAVQEIPVVKATPNYSKPVTPVANSGQKTLIACIDDSAVVVHNLKKILEPAGYRTLSIQEPMAGFAELIKHQPTLILLDLNMPNANGYSVCKFLRESTVFAKTPIIILTSQDTVIDRTRAKLVGATDFIPKPPKPDELLQMIERYLEGIHPSTKTAPPGLHLQPS